MVNIYLVSCVSKKGEYPAKAEDLYNSPLFIKFKAYAKKHSDKWYILSAKYGLLSPDRIIEPYECTLNDMRKPQKITWSDRVFEELIKVVSQEDKIIFLAGNGYRKYLVQMLKDHGYNNISIPMKGLGIGQQLRWLNDNI